MAIRSLPLIVAFLVTLSTVCNSLESNSYCTQDAPLPSDPQIPTLPKSYSIQICAKDIEGKAAYIVHKYVGGNKVAVDNRVRGLTEFRLLDYNTNTLFWRHYDGTCVVTTDPKTITNMNDLNAQGLSLLWSMKSTWKFIKYETVMGVGVNHWRTCANKGNTLNFTTDVYFTEKGKTPFRSEIKGMVSIHGKSRPMHIVEEYFGFRKGKPSADVFKFSPGDVCNVNMTATPPMPDSASYREESHDTKAKTVGYTHIFFDKKLRALRETSADGRVTVRDFTRDLVFDIDYRQGTCKRRVIFTFAGSEDYFGNDHRIHMATLKQFFLADGNFTYNGQYKARGILCDVYSRKTQSSTTIGSDVIEIYLAAKGIYMNSRHYLDKDGISNRPIVRVVHKEGLLMKIKKQFEIFDFEPNPTTEHNIDLSTCYDKGDMIRFHLHLQGPAIKTSNDRRLIKRGLSLQISQALRISPLRVAMFDVHVVQGQYIVDGVLLQKNDDLYSFKEYSSKSPRPGMKWDSGTEPYLYHNSSNTPNLCAQFCVRRDNSQFKSAYCSGFTFNRETKDCIFYKNYLPISYLQYTKDYIDYYSLIDFKYQQWNKWAFEDLQNKVIGGQINYTDSTGSMYKVTAVVTHNMTRPIQAKYTAMQSFQQKDNTIIHTYNPIGQRTGYSLDACARQCLNAISFDCMAFSYESDLKRCLLFDGFKLYADRSDPRKIIPVYIRNYVTEFDRIPGISALTATDTIYTQVGDSNACAKLCVKNTAFFCQSFEFCADTCVLGRKHIFDMKETAVKASDKCEHFSRNYIQDYLKIEKKQALPSSNVVVIKGIGVKKCAQICSTSSGYKCDAFEFCAVTSLCRVTSKYVLNTGKLAYHDAATCDFYTRSSKAADYSQAVKSSLRQSGQSGHTPGQMGGLGFGMILVGLLLAIFIILAVFKFRSRTGGSSDITTVNFSRKRLEEDE